MALRLPGKNSYKTPIMTATADGTESISCKKSEIENGIERDARDELLHFNSG